MTARGLSYAMASVALVSAAQLAMRWSMTRLPAPHQWLAASGGTLDALALAVLATGVAGYAASLVCWLRALTEVPLHRAYSLLALSYPLVYLAAALLPGLGGSLNAGKTAGVVLVLAGVLLINARTAAGSPGADGDNRRK